MHSSFNFYLSNEASNEFLSKTKVVGFQKTNNFHVQSFSSYHTKMGENFEFQGV